MDEKPGSLAEMEIDHSQIHYDAYQNHQVFELIDQMMDYYDGLSDTSFGFSPSGTRSTFNYATHVYMSMRSTLDSIFLSLTRNWQRLSKSTAQGRLNSL